MEYLLKLCNQKKDSFLCIFSLSDTVAFTDQGLNDKSGTISKSTKKNM